MKTINRINVAENTIEQITLFDSEITRWFDKNGYEIETDLVKLNSNVPGIGDAHDLELERVEMLLRHYCAAGYTLNNKVYAPTFAAASDVRKATSTWINREIAPSFWKWAMCGLTLPDISGKIALNKYMAYIGLLASASKPFADVFGKEFDISRVAVVPDAYVTVNGVVDFVNEDDTVEHGVNRKVEINAFDGFAIIRSDLTKGESCTLRGPWLKIFAQATNWSKLFAWAKANGKDSFLDYYGTTRYLKDVDLIITESCFKAKKLYKSWEQYTHAFKELGHTVCVCVQEHAPHAKGMPYQQGQTLQGSEEDALLFAEYAKETVSKYEKEHNAIELLSGAHRAVARMYPTLLAESHTARTIQEKYTSKRNQMLGGRIPELGFNAFLAPDMVAFAQHIFGLEITGSLKAGECAVSTMPKGLVDVTRSPHLDNAHVLLSNQQTMSLVPSTTPTMFINIFDLTTIRLRADYDGDHVWYSDDPLLIALVKKTESVLGNLPIDWEAPESKKGPVNKAEVAKFIVGLTKGSEIGLYADALTKMWANGYDRDVCDWLTYAGNVLIDAAKHGGTKVVQPDAVKALGQFSLPAFAAQAKSDKEHPADSDYWFGARTDRAGNPRAPRCAQSNSFLDTYALKVREIVPETLNVEGSDEFIFDPMVMMINPNRKVIPGLCQKSVYNAETGEYEGGGKFQQIAFRDAAEWDSILDKKSFKGHYQEWEDAKKAQAQKELIEWARDEYTAKGVDMSKFDDDAIFSAIYDVVVRRVFTTNKVTEGYDTVVKSAFWRIFGTKAVEVVSHNVGADLDMSKVLDDLDIDEDED